MLGSGRRLVAEYESRLTAETQRILVDPDATAEDRRWAECYGSFSESGPRAKPA